MSRMQIAVQTMTSFAESLRLAEWAEAEGLASFAVADHYLAFADDDPTFDQITLLAGIAARTSSIELCTLVSPLTFRHPAVLLKAAVAIDEISSGRFTLGVGTGWMEREHELFGLPFPPLNERFEMLEEALAYLRAATDPAAPGMEGRSYHLQPGFEPQPRPTNLRIVVGGSGRERTPRLAARFADELNLFPSERRDEQDRADLFRREATALGRDPNTLLISTATPALVGRDEPEYRERLEAAAQLRGREPSALESRFESFGIPFGTPDRVHDGLSRLALAGITRVYLQVAFDDLDDITAAMEVFKRAADGLD